MLRFQQRLEEAVGEAEDQDVLHRLLAQVVVDAVDLVLVKDAAQLLVQRLAPLRRSPPKGFSSTSRRQPSEVLLRPAPANASAALPNSDGGSAR